MKHLRTLSRRPARADEVSIGEVLQLIVSLLSVVADALLLKEGGATTE